MYIIEVKISDDRFVECENIYAGEIGENNITKLKFNVPEDYKDFYKYLDIIKSDGEKTQTVIEDMGNDTFYYTLPFSLTQGEEVTLQLVMKKNEALFKSNIFILRFNGSIEATQKLEGDFQDTIQFLMENKTSKEEIKEIIEKLALKVPKNEFYNFCIKTNEDLNKKVSEDEFLTFKNDSLNKLNLKVNKTVYEDDKEKLKSDILYLKNEKVNKIDGKGLSEEDYTTKEKNKLINLPTSDELNLELDDIKNTLLRKLDKTDFEEYKTNTNNALNKKVNSSVYLQDKENINNLINDLNEYDQELFNLIDDANTQISNINTSIGDIDSALLELHNYAQTLISGGAL